MNWSYVLHSAKDKHHNLQEILCREWIEFFLTSQMHECKSGWGVFNIYERKSVNFVCVDTRLIDYGDLKTN